MLNEGLGAHRMTFLKCPVESGHTDTDVRGNIGNANRLFEMTENVFFSRRDVGGVATAVLATDVRRI